MSTATELTVEQVKELLPDVRVHILGMTVTARVSGRKERFAAVFVPMQGSWLNFQFSWETVTRAVNGGRVLQV